MHLKGSESCRFVLLLVTLSGFAQCTSYSPSECGSIFITVNSMTNWFMRTPSRNDRIELNWDLSQCSETTADKVPNQVALYTEDPSASNNSDPIASIFTKDHKWGFYITDVKFENINLPGGWKKKTLTKNVSVIPPGPRCFPLWIASFKDGKLLRTECFNIQPTWMFDIRNKIANTPLTRLMIPGTHNAGSYEFAPYYTRNIFERFTLCQDMDIYSQLVFGIRYLDFRISYQNIFKEKLWLNHGMINVRPLLPLFYEIRTFLQSTTHEIVILDVHQLPVGFYQSDNELIMSSHKLLLDAMQQIFKDYIIHYEDLMNSVNTITGPTVSDILNTKKRLIIGYPDYKIRNQNKWLWPAVSHVWANTNDPHQLKRYLDNMMNSPVKPSNLWSAMAQMTPTPLDIVLSDKSLRKMADDVNRNLTKWVQYDWYGKANIIASDFFMGNNVINLAVYSNSVVGKLRKTTLGKLLFSF